MKTHNINVNFDLGMDPLAMQCGSSSFPSCSSDKTCSTCNLVGGQHADSIAIWVLFENLAKGKGAAGVEACVSGAESGVE